jgi:tRNA-dihydrouridine synthase B
MKNNFWKNLKEKNKPFYALAPMAGITDSAFRRMCKKFGADVLYSEMASATALNYDSKTTLKMLKFNESERPYVVQLFGGEPIYFENAARIISQTLEPDGIDINFGCPVTKVLKQKAGVELFKDLKRAKEAIKYVLAGTDLPVSIKTRSRAGETDVLRFLDNIGDLDVKAVMIHGRTPAQGFDGPIDAEIIKSARNYFGGVILANGGVKDRDSALDILDNAEADGLGIAQAALGRPWIFKAVRTGRNLRRSPRAIAKEALEHCQLAYEDKNDQGIIEMRKHLCWYVQGLPGAKEMRRELVKVESLDDVRRIFRIREDLNG